MCNQEQALQDALQIELTAGNGAFLINDDAIQAMSCLPAKSVDLICVDLPYGTTANKWDIIIPFDKLWLQLNRIAKDNAAMVFTAHHPFTYKLIASNPDNFKYEIIWQKDKPTGFLQAKKRIMAIHENICIFYRKQPTYNPQMTVGKPYTSNGAKQSSNYNKSSFKKRSINNIGTRYPISIIQINREHSKLHPTQKPVALMEYLIKTYSNEGDVVLDCCMGSGTTGIAAKNLNRSFIGIELDSTYFASAQKRIEAISHV